MAYIPGESDRSLTRVMSTFLVTDARNFCIDQVEIRGKVVGDELLAPKWPSYNHRLQYHDTYDGFMNLSKPRCHPRTVFGVKLWALVRVGAGYFSCNAWIVFLTFNIFHRYQMLKYSDSSHAVDYQSLPRWSWETRRIYVYQLTLA